MLLASSPDRVGVVFCVQTLYSLLSADSTCRSSFQQTPAFSDDFFVSSLFRSVSGPLPFLYDYSPCYLTQLSFVGVRRCHHSLQSVQANVCTYADEGMPVHAPSHPGGVRHSRRSRLTTPASLLDKRMSVRVRPDFASVHGHLFRRS